MSAAALVPRSACRFSACWSEALAIPPEARWGADPGAPPAALAAVPDAAPWRVSSGRPPADDALASTLEAAAERRLPTTVRASGLSFPSFVPLIIDHAGEVLGYATDFTRLDRDFIARGIAAPEHYAALSALRHLSPGIRTLAAEIVEAGPASFLYVTTAEVVELSATNGPLRGGTVFACMRPAALTEPEREAFAAVLEDRLVFAGGGAS